MSEKDRQKGNKTLFLQKKLDFWTPQKRKVCALIYGYRIMFVRLLHSTSVSIFIFWYVEILQTPLFHFILPIPIRIARLKCCGKLIMKCWKRNEKNWVKLLCIYIWNGAILSSEWIIYTLFTWTAKVKQEEKMSRKFSSWTISCYFLANIQQTAPPVFFGVTCPYN